MLKRIACVGLMLSNSLGWACHYPGTALLPAGTTFGIGPTVSSVVNSNAAYVSAILNARDAWNVTAAANLIGGWSGQVTNSDCPYGPRQIGAVPFYQCPQFSDPVTKFKVAIMDFATQSITLNLAYSWSINPSLYEHDVQTVLTHEFGHVLGLQHQDNGQCTDTTTLSCDTSPRAETMSSDNFSGQTCRRVLSTNDINSANALYNGIGGF